MDTIKYKESLYENSDKITFNLTRGCAVSAGELFKEVTGVFIDKEMEETLKTIGLTNAISSYSDFVNFCSSAHSEYEKKYYIYDIVVRNDSIGKMVQIYNSRLNPMSVITPKDSYLVGFFMTDECLETLFGMDMDGDMLIVGPGGSRRKMVSMYERAFEENRDA